MRRIKVAMGEGIVAEAPDVISSEGLGSCVSVVLYDGRRSIGGLAHVMLPDSSHFRFRISDSGLNEKSEISYRYADTAIAALLREMRGKGAGDRDIVAKIIGGARMFSAEDEGIGQKNVASIKNLLCGEHIPLVGWDTGGSHGRSVEFHLETGRVVVRSVDSADREL